MNKIHSTAKRKTPQIINTLIFYFDLWRKKTFSLLYFSMFMHLCTDDQKFIKLKVSQTWGVYFNVPFVFLFLFLFIYGLSLVQFSLLKIAGEH